MSDLQSKPDPAVSTVAPNVQKKSKRGPMIRPARPTHFLSFPIRDPSCHIRASELSRILLDAKPRPDGVDESLVVHPKSLHLTLGIMTLLGRQAAQRVENEEEETVQIDVQRGYIPPQMRKPKSVDDAAKLLRECQQALRDILQPKEDYKSGIPVRFDRLESFQSDPAKCRVLYAEPEKNSGSVKTLHELGEHLRQRFLAAGMLADASQPLTLHCTLMKASARKNKLNKPRLEDLTRAAAQPEAKDREDGSDEAMPSGTEETPDQQMAVPQTETPKKQKRRRGRFPKKHPFDASLLLAAEAPYELGISNIDRVQLCQMGRHLPSGEYEALEEILLFPDSDEMAA